MSLRFLVRRSRKHLYLALLVLVFAGAGLFFLLGKIAGYFLVDREIAIKEDPARIRFCFMTRKRWWKWGWRNI